MFILPIAVAFAKNVFFFFRKKKPKWNKSLANNSNKRSVLC